MSKKYFWNKIKIGTIWIVKNSYKALIAIGGVSAGAAAITTASPLLAIAGATALASTVSSSVRDGNIKPVMFLVNAVACNIDKAQNDKKVNR